MHSVQHLLTKPCLTRSEALAICREYSVGERMFSSWVKGSTALGIVLPGYKSRRRYVTAELKKLLTLTRV